MNRHNHTFRKLARSAAHLGAVALFVNGAALSWAATADDSGDGPVTKLEEVQVNEARSSATTMAVSEAPLDAVQPVSIVNLQTIQNNIPPTADYALIANLTPSISTSSTNGPGLNEAKVTLRGLADGFYNVTFDGIPFGDGNDFTHHTNSYFPAKLIGKEAVDRGPGTASTIGMATFGGTIAMFSKDPLETASVVPTYSYGSWNTQLANLDGNTGTLANGGQLEAMYQYLSSDGWHTFGTLARNTYFLKYIQPLTKNITLTTVGEYNNIKFNNPNNSTPTYTQLITLGRNFAQTNNLLDPNGDDYQRNHQEKHTDLDYVGLDGKWGNWEAHNKVYTFGYNNVSHESPNQVSGLSKTDPGGQVKVNVVRAYGDTFQVSHDDFIGTFKAGIWVDYQHGPRYNYYYDEFNSTAGPVVQNNFLDITHKGSNGGYAWNMHYWTWTFDPYAEYNWNITSALTFDVGVKYMHVNRVVSGPVNQDKEVNAFHYDQTFARPLPLASLNYKLTKDWSTYFQYAQGFLTPALAQSSVANPQLNQSKIQNTTNYQLGTVFKTNRLNADIDGYYIHYTNLPVTYLNPAEVPGTPNYDANDLIYFFAKGAVYSGVEAEATFYVGQGLSVYANGSRNYGIYDGAKRRIENIPQSTSGFGFMYDKGGFNSSLIAKYIGPYIVYSGAPNDPTQPLPVGSYSVTQGGYTMFDLSLGYGMKFPKGYFIKSAKIRMQCTDLFNREVNLLKKPNANNALSTFSALTPRGFFFTIAGEF